MAITPITNAVGLIQLAALDSPATRWIAGTDAISAVEQKAHDLLAQADAHRALSSSLDHAALGANRPRHRTARPTPGHPPHAHLEGA